MIDGAAVARRSGSLAGAGLGQRRRRPEHAARPRGGRRAGARQLDQAITLYTEALAGQDPAQRAPRHPPDRPRRRPRTAAEPKEAIEDFNRAIQLYPEYAAVYNNRGNVLLGVGAVREAMKDFDRALVLAPGYAAAFSNRAGAHMRLGQIDPGARRLHQGDRAGAGQPCGIHRARPGASGRLPAAERHPGLHAGRDARCALQRGLPRTGRGQDGHRALRRGDRGLQPGHRLRGPQRRISTCCAARPTWRPATPHPRSRTSPPPSSSARRRPGHYAARGFAYAKAEAYEEALNDFARAIELDPRSPKAFAYRAWTYRQQQQPELGLKDVERALKLDANSAEAYWARGEIHEAQGRASQAIADLQRR